MSTATLPTDATVIEYPETRILLSPVIPMTQDQYFDFCQLNEDKRFERTAEGELIILSPSGGESSIQKLLVAAQVYVWNSAGKDGKVTDSSGDYILPNGANRAPDTAWITPAQLATITSAQRKKFLPVCPHFVAEVMSASDVLSTFQEKMEEFIANGCKLGWLIDPSKRQVQVYRPGLPVEVLDGPQTLSGDPELPGFVLDLGPVWQP